MKDPEVIVDLGILLCELVAKWSFHPNFMTNSITFLRIHELSGNQFTDNKSDRRETK